MVTIYHYTDYQEFELIIWIPTAFALFIFAFSSGFFTAMKYQHPFHIKKFWTAKVDRLLYPIFVIDIFLFTIFLFQHRTGIFTWQTLFSMVGLNGFFGWYNNISNPSPFGAGLWFFTLLFIFYLFYPLLSIFNKRKSIAILILLVILLLTTLFQELNPSSPLFWMTQFAFILGAYSGVHEHYMPPLLCAILFTITCLLMLVLNTIIGINTLNYMLVLLASISIVGFLLNVKLPTFLLSKTLVLSGCVVEIYFIHSYLYIRSITSYQAINYLVSISLIIVVALILNKIAINLRAIIAKLQSTNQKIA